MAKTKETAQAEEKSEKEKEADLYPKLAQFCGSIGIKTLTVMVQGGNCGVGGENEWRYPDVVGFKDIAAEQEEYTQELMTALGASRSELYSFEVKSGKIKQSNLRKFVLQAAGNSSWANCSYLVAEGVTERAKPSLKELCETFSLGFISLNRETPEKSEIVFEAPKTGLNWSAINKLAEISEEFQRYTEYVVAETKRFENPNLVEPEWNSIER